MYIRDIIPFSDNCVFMCLIPMYINCITEIMFIGYMNLLRLRIIKLRKTIDNLKANYNSSNLTNDEKIFYISEMFNNQRSSRKAKIYPKSTNILEDDMLSNILTIQKIYYQIHEGVHLVNYSFGIQLVFLLMQQFSTLTTLLYYCVSNVMK